MCDLDVTYHIRVIIGEFSFLYEKKGQKNNKCSALSTVSKSSEMSFAGLGSRSSMLSNLLSLATNLALALGDVQYSKFVLRCLPECRLNTTNIAAIADCEAPFEPLLVNV